MIYLYDGSYFGFLSVVYVNYYEKRATEVLVKEDSPGIFLDESKEIITVTDNALKVEKAISEKCGNKVAGWIYYAFHSAAPQKDIWLIRFIELAFQLGRKTENALSEPSVAKIWGLSQKVARERHKFLGFVRFEEIRSGTENYLYSRIEPDNNVLPLMGNHFSKRFYREKIIIHDIRRKTALLSHQGKWEILSFPLRWQDILKNKTKQEADFQKLWQGYFEHISIEERYSKKRQQQFVPLKYRNHLIEFQKPMHD